MTHKITKTAALLELDGEVVMLNLSNDAWNEILAIAARDNGGKLSVGCIPNQEIFDAIDLNQTPFNPKLAIARSTLYGIANTFDDHELRNKAAEAYDQLA